MSFKLNTSPIRVIQVWYACQYSIQVGYGTQDTPLKRKCLSFIYESDHVDGGGDKFQLNMYCVAI